MGRIARIHPGGKIVFAYLFGPFSALPSGEVLDELSPSEAVLVGMISDVGLVLEEWPVLGSRKWPRDEWPLVPLRNVDRITQRVRRVEYRDGDLVTPVVWEVADDDTFSAPTDKLYGHISLQNRLLRLLRLEN